MSTEIERLIVEMEAKTAKFNADMRKAAGVQQRTTDSITSNLNKQTRSQNRATQATDLFKLSTIAAGVSAALAGRKIIEYADAYTLITNKLKLSATSTENLTEMTERLFVVANTARQSVSATADLYAKMERATRNLNISQDRLVKITSSVTKAFSISGATAQESSGSIRQLGQALASGTLRGDEFNSIAEQAPIIMEAVKEATGKTAGELRTLAATGAITADVLIESLERYEDKINTDFSTATATFGQKLEVAANNAIKFVGESEAINSVVGRLGDMLIDLSTNIDTVITGVQTLSAVLLTRFVVAQAVAIRSTIALSAAAISAAGGLGTMTGAAVAARTAFSLLFGPVGLIIAAVGALIAFNSEQDETDTKITKLTESVKKQTAAYKDLNAETARSTLIDARAKQERLEGLARDVKEERARLQTLVSESSGAPSALGAIFSTTAVGKFLGDVTDASKGVTQIKKDLSAQLDLERDINMELEAQNTLIDSLVAVDTKRAEVKKELIDLEGAARVKAAEKAVEKMLEQEERVEQARLNALAASLQNQLDAIDKRQLALQASNETELDALQIRYESEQELIALAEENKVLTHEEGILRRQELDDEMAERSQDLADTEMEKLVERLDLELELIKQLHEQSLISEEDKINRINQLNSKGIMERMDLARKEAIAKSGLENNTLKTSVQALETFGKKSETAARAAFNIKKLQKGSEAAVGTYAAVVEALPNYSLAIATGLLGAAQIASIASESFDGGGSGSTPNIGGGAPEEATNAIPEAEQASLTVDETIDSGAGLNSSAVELEFTADSGDQIGEMMADLVNSSIKNGRVAGVA